MICNGATRMVGVGLPCGYSTGTNNQLTLVLVVQMQLMPVAHMLTQLSFLLLWPLLAAVGVKRHFAFQDCLTRGLTHVVTY